MNRVELKMAIEELVKSRKYHDRQLEDNRIKIKNHHESIALLEKSSEKHVEYITQIDRLIEFIEKEVE